MLHPRPMTAISLQEEQVNCRFSTEGCGYYKILPRRSVLDAAVSPLVNKQEERTKLLARSVLMRVESVATRHTVVVEHRCKPPVPFKSDGPQSDCSIVRRMWLQLLQLLVGRMSHSLPQHMQSQLACWSAYTWRNHGPGSPCTVHSLRHFFCHKSCNLHHRYNSMQLKLTLAQPPQELQSAGQSRSLATCPPYPPYSRQQRLCVRMQPTQLGYQLYAMNRTSVMHGFQLCKTMPLGRRRVLWSIRFSASWTICGRARSDRTSLLGSTLYGFSPSRYPGSLLS